MTRFSLAFMSNRTILLYCCKIAFYCSFGHRQHYRHLLGGNGGGRSNQMIYFSLSFSQLIYRHITDIIVY